MTASDSPTITQFTDPMCTWCWGAEPIRRRLQTAYGDRLTHRFVLGGLIEDFETFYDAANDISDPEDVGPHWLAAAERHGMPVDTEIFEVDPAQSTYPASVAVAAARQQGWEAGHRYLRRVREAYATEVRNVNRPAIQREIAADLGLDIGAFRAAIDDGTAREAFEEDLARTREARIGSFPTYRLTGPEGTRTLAGFRSFEELADTLETVAPSLERTSPPAVEQFVREYGPVATQEVATVCALSHGKATQTLKSLADRDTLVREQRGTGVFWRVPAESTG
ncbi:DsbA family protein [Halomicroarcula sp. GCM10025709]|uniref:DsbA family protein n=1 Tax=Haloarcula TaxID=2237 RepID=UPI0024C4235D|nr:DsbA family protein [Halomicroarcula sp. YJ-61-S]